MSYELRLSQLKKTWMPIQDLNEEIKSAQLELADLREKFRSLSQKIPEKIRKRDSMLSEFNKVMV